MSALLLGGAGVALVILSFTGFVWNEFSPIYRLISLEFGILGFIFVFISFSTSDLVPLVLIIFLVAIAASESVVGLSVILIFYKLNFGLNKKIKKLEHDWH
jgi:NADH:ubiquinone oxidoreductase subunit K